MNECLQYWAACSLLDGLFVAGKLRSVFESLFFGVLVASWKSLVIDYNVAVRSLYKKVNPAT